MSFAKFFNKQIMNPYIISAYATSGIILGAFEPNSRYVDSLNFKEKFYENMLNISVYGLTGVGLGVFHPFPLVLGGIGVLSTVLKSKKE
jgi:hypothetical protein